VISSAYNRSNAQGAHIGRWAWALKTDVTRTYRERSPRTPFGASVRVGDNTSGRGFVNAKPSLRIYLVGGEFVSHAAIGV